MTPAEQPRPSSHWRSLQAVLAGSLFSGATLTLGSSAVGSPLLLLGVPLVLGAGVLLMLWPAIAFMLTAFIIPIERLGRLTADDAMYTISLMRIVGTLALGSFLLHALIRRRKIAFGSAFWLYAAYFCLALLGVFHSSHQLGTVRACGAILGNLLFFWLVINIAQAPRLAKTAVALWLTSTVIVGVFTIITWHFGKGVSEADLGETASRFSTVMVDTSEWEALDSTARAAGPTSHAAVYAMNLILTLPFFLYFFKHQRGTGWRLLIGGGLLVTLYNVFLTNTRAAILLAVAVLLLCGARGLYRFSAGGVVVALLAVAAMLPLAPEAVWHRVLDTSNYSLERSATLRIRFEYWAAGLQVAQDHWLAGIGVGNQQVIPLYIKGDAPEETTVHNEYIMTAMEVGLLGWGVFFGFVALMYAAARRAAQLVPGRWPPSLLHADFFVAAQVAMLATAIYGLQVDVFHFPLKGWWLIAGISWALYRVLLEEKPIQVHNTERSAQ